MDGAKDAVGRAGELLGMALKAPPHKRADQLAHELFASAPADLKVTGYCTASSAPDVYSSIQMDPVGFSLSYCGCNR